jgi:hypothetical protein
MQRIALNQRGLKNLPRRTHEKLAAFKIGSRTTSTACIRLYPADCAKAGNTVGLHRLLCHLLAAGAPALQKMLNASGIKLI